MAAELTPLVEAADDLELLERLFDKALDGISLKEVRAALKLRGSE